MTHEQFERVLSQFPWVWGIFQDWTTTGYTNIELNVRKLGAEDPLAFSFSTPLLEDKRVWITFSHTIGLHNPPVDSLERLGPIPGQTIAECILGKYREVLCTPRQLAISWVENGNKGLTIYRPGRGEYFPVLVRDSYKQHLKKREKLLK